MFKPFELKLHTLIFNFFFDKGMILACKDGKKTQYMDQKLFDIFSDKDINNAFSIIGGIKMDIVTDAINNVQSKNINKAFLMYKGLSFQAIDFKDRKVMLTDKEVTFYLRHDAQNLSGNKLIQPTAEHIASTLNKVEKSLSSLRRFKTIQPYKSEVATARQLQSLADMF